MRRAFWLAILVPVIGIANGAARAAPLAFRWQKGQALTYRVEHVTRVTDNVPGNRLEMTSRLSLVKRWEIDDVDENGTATLRLKVLAMRNEQARGNSEPLIFDSEHPDRSTPELHAQMSKFIGKVLAIIRVDANGRVLKTLEGSASQFDADVPFLVQLPGGELKQGHTWERTFHFTLKPPFGAGEKYRAAQQCQLLKLDAGQAHVRVATKVQDMPRSPVEQLPLLQKQPAGEIVFDVAAGRLLRAMLQVHGQVAGHQGPGSSYRFESRYTEELVK